MTKIGMRLAAILIGLMLGPAVSLAANEPPAMSEEEMIVAQNPGAGFIRSATPYEARVSSVTGDSQTTGNKRLLGAGDQIYLDLTNPQEAAPGDRFTVYRRTKKIFHPVRGDYLGDLTAVVGVVKVLRVTGSKGTVRIERSYGAMYPGDGASHHIASGPPAPAPVSHALPDGTGVIVELPLGQTLIGQGHMVYVDWGRSDGLKIGDRLQVFREHADIPTQIIGELQIIAVEERTATARITKSTAPFVRGDRFTALQKQLGADAPSPQDRKEALFKEMTPAAATPRTAEAVQEAHAAPQSRDIERELAELVKQLEFDPGNAPVTAASMPKLKQIKALLKEVPDRRMVVKGYTDNQSIGPSLKQLYTSNQELSRARAESVASYLSKENEINQQNISVAGYAATKPVASNGSEAGRKKNRRIEIVLLPSEPAPAPKAAMPEAIEPPPSAPEPAPAETAPPAR
ncbi:MAG: OmpA family protein [Nitrospiraceae bacterium]